MCSSDEISPKFQKPAKTKSLDLMTESITMKKSNHGHKSHFSNYDAVKENENGKDLMISSQVKNELEKIMMINKPKIRKILTKSILIMLKTQLDLKISPPNGEESAREPHFQRKKSWNPLNLKLELGNFNFMPTQEENNKLFLESKSATFTQSSDRFLVNFFRYFRKN